MAPGKTAKACLRVRPHKPQCHPPLKVTPPLGLTGYVFPIVGSSSFGDSYGATRSDIVNGWHHGDDIFAALGVPVVAVADGTLTGIGWQRIGGWRLWLQDAAGNRFYYAHLSGYAPVALRGGRVRAGQVIAFMGDTGDAITTSFHLHFEIHPASLLYLGEDGAVDPTGYLQGWKRLPNVAAPRPVHPALPPGLSGQQADRIFRELLAARRRTWHAAHRRTGLWTRTVDRVDHRTRATYRELQGGSASASAGTALSALSETKAGSSNAIIGGLAAAVAAAMLAGFLLLRRQVWRRVRECRQEEV